MKMYQFLILVFLSMVLYQTVAKQRKWPLISNGLITVKNNAANLFERIGNFIGNLVNIHKWLKRLQTLFKDLWRIVREHIWENIRPFFESILEIVQPTWQLLFSWVYFFVGFAKTHFLAFSYLGGAICLVTTGYFTRFYWITYYDNWKDEYTGYTIAVFVATTVGTIIAYPNIPYDLFPTLKHIVDNAEWKNGRLIIPNIEK